MGFSRKEVHIWLETASDEQLQHVLNKSKGIFSNLTDRDDIAPMKWLIAKIIAEINARKEAKQS